MEKLKNPSQIAYSIRKTNAIQVKDQEDPECYQEEWIKYQLSYAENYMKEMNRIAKDQSMTAKEKEVRFKQLLNNKISNRFLIQTLKVTPEEEQKLRKLQAFLRQKVHKDISKKILVGNDIFRRESFHVKKQAKLK